MYLPRDPDWMLQVIFPPHGRERFSPGEFIARFDCYKIMKKSLNAFIAIVGLATPTFLSAANLLAPSQPILGVAATPGSATSAIATIGTVAGVNNFPGTESATNTIDGATGTKYLNFAEVNVGFIVTIPNSSVVTGFQFTAANDAAERDPISVTIEGASASDPSSAAANATWTLLYSGPSGLASDPGRQTNGAVISVANGAGFNTYRLLVTDVRNQATANSMQFSEVQFFGLTNDTAAPIVVSTIPPRGASVRNLTQIEVLFNEAVDGVDASDLLVNGVPATDLTFGTPEQFVFTFTQPPTGAVTIAFAPNHGIHDRAAVSNVFTGDSWTYNLDPNAAFSDVRINEFLADNGTGIRDEDSTRQDWIELYNGGPTPVNLAGWFLTDETANLTKWCFPAGVQLQPNAYLLVWASAKDRTNIGALHTNFRLGKNGGFLGLVGPDSNTLVSAFSPYPAQRTDASYGRDRLDPSILGFYDVPTPRAANAVSGRSGFAPDVEFSASSGTFTSPFTVTLSTASTNAVIRYVLITNAALASASVTNVPTTNSPIYTGPITINMTTELRARTFQTGLFPGTPATENYIQINNEVRNFNSDLPVIVIHVLGNGSIPALSSGQGSGILMAFDNGTTNAASGTNGHRSSLTNAPQVASRMGIHIRGSSTLGNAKSNLRIETWDEFNQDQDYPLVGMPSDSDWVLYGINQFDPGLMHNAIYQWLGKQVGVPFMRTRYVEVFRKLDNGPVTTNDYFGLYLLLETPKIAKDRLNIEELHDQDTNATAITGGYIAKIDRTDTERTITTPTIGGIRPPPASIAFVDPPFKTGETDPRRLAQINYFQSYIFNFLTNLSSPSYTNPVTGYAQFINPQQWMNHLIANIIPFNVDGYRLSGYFYKDRNGRLEQGPMWDCDRCLGTGGSGATPNGDNRCFSPRYWRLPANDVNTDNGTDFFGVSNVGVSWFTPLFRDPNFWQSFIDSYQRFRTNEFSSNSIASMITGFYNEIKEAQVREQAKWGTAGFTYPRSLVQTVNGYTFDFGPADNFNRGRFTNEVNFQKKWLLDRLEFLDTNFLNMPKLSSGTALVPSGTMVTATPATKANSILLYTLDGTDPRASAGGVSPSALMQTGPLTLTVTTNIRLFARSYNSSHANMTNSGTEVGKPLINSFWSGPVAATYFTTVPTLRITVVLYHPAPPTSQTDTNDADNFEFVELKNIGSTTLNLAGFNLSGGIDFTFTNFTLAAGQYCVVVKNAAAFLSRYGAGPAIAGAFQGNLANDGDHVVLRGPLQEPIQDFVYQDSWYPLTDTQGFSLVIQDETATSNLSTNTSWRQSSVDGGSPGATNPPTTVVSDVVLVNEALTHTDLPFVDVVELYNAGTNDANISGWWLTDDLGTPKKYQIPNGTILPAGSYILFDENQFNAGGTGFALGSDGDDIYVFSGTNGFITGYFHGFNFGPAQNGRTFGRYVNSQTNEHFVAQATNTLGTNNSLPLVGPIVINEIMYHPPETGSGTDLTDNSLDEFIELRNITSTNVPLYHSLFPSNTWRLSSAVDFSFPTNASIGPTGFAIVVSFDPIIGGTAFRTKYGVPDAVQLYGPYGGKLDNSSESVRLSRPDAPNGPNVPFILVDRVDYADAVPWAFAADGYGGSLHRLVPGNYGNDPTNWVAARPTPGSTIEGGASAVILQQPINVTVIEGLTTNISVSVSSPSPVTYQWQQNSNTVPGATSATLVFSNIQASQAGTYTVNIFNGGGVTFSAPAIVNVRRIPIITQQPLSQNVATNSTFSFTVAATGTGPLRYQWRFMPSGGAPTNIANATNSTLTYSNAELFAHSGYYDVSITDDVGTRFSDVATLIVLTRPFSVVQPAGQTVLQGQTARYTVLAGPQHPLLPLTYRWLINGIAVVTNTSGVLVVTNCQPPSKTVRAAATNLATGVAGLGVFNTTNLTILPDFDRDGMADAWEVQFGFNTNSVADGALDFDGDGMINRDEYVAGTDPTDPLSLLKIFTTTNASVLQFVAQSNIAYTVQYRTNFTNAAWNTLTNVTGQPGIRTVDVNNILGPPPPDERYFRVLTPPEP
jgi:hypothetical protein